MAVGHDTVESCHMVLEALTPNIAGMHIKYRSQSILGIAISGYLLQKPQNVSAVKKQTKSQVIQHGHFIYFMSCNVCI